MKKRKIVALLLCLIFSLSYLSACRAKKEHIIEFETYGATGIESIKAKEGNQITLPTPQWPHYQFSGWYSDDSFTQSALLSSPFTMQANDIKMFAHFTPLSGYLINFETDGGSPVESLAKEEGEAIAQPSAPTKEGYNFLGWYTSDEQLYTFTEMPANSFTLYAKWESNSNLVAVNFYGNGRLLSTKYVEKNTTVSADSIIPTSEYTLLGSWRRGDNDSVFNFNTPVNEQTKLDLHIKYRTKALTISSGVVTAYTGNTQNAIIVVDDTASKIGASAFKGKTRISTVYLDGAVTEIQESAFSGCTSLARIYGTSKAVTVADNAFYNCSKLTSIELQSVKDIGKSAFSSCAALSSVTLGEAILNIGERAFLNCRALTAIRFNSGLQSIGDYAFQNCTKLTEFSVPKSVTLGGGVLEGCTSIRSFTLMEGSGTTDNYMSGDGGNIYSVGGERLVYFSEKTKATFEIPEGVTDVEKNAFAGAVSLTHIILPQSLTAEGSFGILSPCINLNTVSIFNFKKIPFISHLYGAQSARDNSSISSIVPTNLKTINITDNNFNEIAPYAFYGCAGITSVTGIEKAKKIGKYAFAYTKFFSSFEVGDSVTSIGEGAFLGCNLTHFSVNSGNTNFITGNNLNYLYNKTEKLLIRALPSFAENNFNLFAGISTVGDYAFEDCVEITRLDMPQTVTAIGDGAFKGCRYIKNITMSLEGILSKNRTFSALTDGTSIELDELKILSGTIIPDNAFNAVRIKKIILPTTITEIGIKSFYENSSLTQITGLDNVENIGESAFENCTKLADFTFGDSLEVIGLYAFAAIAVEHLEFPLSLKTIGDGAFSKTYNLTSIAFRGDVKNSLLENIGDSVFSTIGSILGGDVVLPAGIKKIGNGAFSTTKITSLSFAGTPATALELGTYVFSGNRLLKSADISNLNIEILPASTFADCVEAESILLPSTLKAVGSFAFIRCSKLENVDIPAGVIAVGQRILDDSGWAKKQPSGIMYKDHIAVGYKGNIEENADIVFESTVNEVDITVICSRVFWSVGVQGASSSEWIDFSYGNIVSITIPSTYIYINEEAFVDAYNVKTVSIGKGVKIIGNLAFSGCKALTNIVIGEANQSALEYLGAFAFLGCGALTSIRLRKTVGSVSAASILYNKDINGEFTAFALSYKDVAVTDEATDEVSYFKEVTAFLKLTIYVPAGCAAYYRTAWGNLVQAGRITITESGE